MRQVLLPVERVVVEHLFKLSAYCSGVIRLEGDEDLPAAPGNRFDVIHAAVASIGGNLSDCDQHFGQIAQWGETKWVGTEVSRGGQDGGLDSVVHAVSVNRVSRCIPASPCGILPSIEHSVFIFPLGFPLPKGRNLVYDCDRVGVHLSLNIQRIPVSRSYV